MALGITAREYRIVALMNRRVGPARPLDNATTQGEMQRCQADDGLVVTPSVVLRDRVRDFRPR